MSRKKAPASATENDMIASRLREQMQKKGINQAQLADLIGCRRQTTSNYCAGQSTPDGKMLCKIADALGCTTDYLVGRCDIPAIDVETTSIGEKLGLTQEAVDNIILTNKLVPFAGLLSHILASEHFTELVSMFADITVLGEDINGAVCIARGLYSDGQPGYIDSSVLGDMTRELRYGQYGFAEPCKAILDDVLECVDLPTVLDILLFAQSYLDEVRINDKLRVTEAEGKESNVRDAEDGNENT